MEMMSSAFHVGSSESQENPKLSLRAQVSVILQCSVIGSLSLAEEASTDGEKFPQWHAAVSAQHPGSPAVSK